MNIIGDMWLDVHHKPEAGKVVKTKTRWGDSFIIADAMWDGYQWASSHGDPIHMKQPQFWLLGSEQ